MALHTALVERRDVAPGVRVFALGPLRAERARDADRALGRRQGRQPPGPGAVRVPLRPRRAGRGEGRGPGAHLARRRPRAGRPRLPPDDGRAAVDPGPGPPEGRAVPRSGSRTIATGWPTVPSAWSDVGRLPRGARRRRRRRAVRPDPAPGGGAAPLPRRLPRRLPLLRRQRLRRGTARAAAQPASSISSSPSGRATSPVGTACPRPPPSGRRSRGRRTVAPRPRPDSGAWGSDPRRHRRIAAVLPRSFRGGRRARCEGQRLARERLPCRSTSRSARSPVRHTRPVIAAAGGRRSHRRRAAGRPATWPAAREHDVRAPPRRALPRRVPRLPRPRDGRGPRPGGPAPADGRDRHEGRAGEHAGVDAPRDREPRRVAGPAGRR